MKNVMVPFSKRYQKAIADGRIKVILPKKVRGRIWQTLENYDDNYFDHPDLSNPTWNVATSPSHETYCDLLQIYGTPNLVVDRPGVLSATYQQVCREYAMTCRADELFDLIQIWIGYLGPPVRKHLLQQSINTIFDQEEVGWILSNQNFYKLDNKFMEESVLSPAAELLIEWNYTGPLEEFQKARAYLDEGDHKQAIDHAYMAYESALKAVAGKSTGKFGELLGKIPEQFFHGLPTGTDKVFRNSVFNCLQPIRNNLGGHGQGAQSYDVPRDFAELAVHLAGSLIVFLIKRQAAMVPLPEEQEAEQWLVSDDVPF